MEQATAHGTATGGEAEWQEQNEDAHHRATFGFRHTAQQREAGLWWEARGATDSNPNPSRKLEV